MKHLWKLPLVAASIGFLVWAPWARQAERPDPTPAILEQLALMGELKTAQMNLQRHMPYETHADPTGPLAGMPGAQQVTTHFTRNRALTTISTQVEAGVDLTQARTQRSKDGVIITLPRPKIGEANVRVQLQDWRPGLLWRDLGLPEKAESDAARWAERAARESGLVQKAQQQAERVLRDTLQPMTDQTLTIRFAEPK